jgi:hypothetical protein
MPFVSSLLLSAKFEIEQKSPLSPLLDIINNQLESLIALYGPKFESVDVLFSDASSITSSIDDEDFRKEFERRLQRAIFDAATVLTSVDETSTLMYGKGIYIKRMWLPSYDPLLEALELIFPWIPNCKRYL